MIRYLWEIVGVKKKHSSKNSTFTSRLMILQYLFVFFVVLFIIYLFAIQVIDIKHFRIKAKKQRQAYSFVMRGSIFDRNGIKLATDTVYYDIFARKAESFVSFPQQPFSSFLSREYDDR